MENNYIIVGSRGTASAVRMAVFRSVTEGKADNACYMRSDGNKSLFQKSMYLVLKNVIYKPTLAAKARCCLNLRTKFVEAKFRSGLRNIVIYVPGTKYRWAYEAGMPKKIRRRHPDCVQVFYLVDSMDRMAFCNYISTEEMAEYLKQFDFVFTYNRIDSEKYGYPYVEIPVWESREEAPGITCDLYFNGRNKGRAAFLKELLKKAKEKDVNCAYDVIAPTRTEKPVDGLNYTQWMDYADIVRHTRQSNCILEISAEHTTGLTLRCKEAVIYNKKLLTDNPEIRNMPYYDARWMRIYSSVDDIDYEWLKKRENVDYGYRGEFSAKTFLETVGRQIENGN